MGGIGVSASGCSRSVSGCLGSWQRAIDARSMRCRPPGSALPRGVDVRGFRPSRDCVRDLGSGAASRRCDDPDRGLRAWWAGRPELRVVTSPPCQVAAHRPGSANRPPRSSQRGDIGEVGPSVRPVVRDRRRAMLGHEESPMRPREVPSRWSRVAGSGSPSMESVAIRWLPSSTAIRVAAAPSIPDVSRL